MVANCSNPRAEFLNRALSNCVHSLYCVCALRNLGAHSLGRHLFLIYQSLRLLEFAGNISMSVGQGYMTSRPVLSRWMGSRDLT